MTIVFSCILTYFTVQYIIPKKKIDPSGKVVLITGCDSGFGKMLVKYASEAGFEVIAACFTQKGSDHFSGGGISSVVADLTTKEGVTKVVEITKTVAGNRGLYALVNNAGIFRGGEIGYVRPEIYKMQMDINYLAPVTLTHELLIPIRQAKGRVINVTSVSGLLAPPQFAGYAASKQAFEAFSDVLRYEEHKWGVKVVIIEPTYMKTPMTHLIGDAFVKAYHDADEEKKAPYGEKWIKTAKEIVMKNVKDHASDPKLTVDALLEALILEEPPIRMPTGNKVIHFMVTVMRMIPDGLRDRFVINQHKSLPSALS